MSDTAGNEKVAPAGSGGRSGSDHEVAHGVPIKLTKHHLGTEKPVASANMLIPADEIGDGDVTKPTDARPLFSAIKTNRPLVILTTAVMIACLALLLDWLGGVLQRAATPRGIR